MWNIAGTHRGFPSLATFASTYKPWFIFLSEPQVYNCNVHLYTNHLPHYNLHHNSDDTYLPNLPMETLRAKGGTMVLWDRDIDSNVTILPTTSSAVLPLHLGIPGLGQSIHIGIYLPTSGCEQEWTIALSTLPMVVDDAVTLSRSPHIHLG